MDTNKAQLNPFDVYFKQSVSYFTQHVWSFAGLYLFSVLLTGVVGVVLLIPTSVFGILSVNARGMTLDVYIALGILFLMLMVFTFMYLTSVFTKSYYLIIDEKTPALHAFERSFSTSMGLFKTLFLRSAVIWGYLIVLLLIVGITSALSYSVDTPLLVLTLFLAIPMLFVALLVLAYFKLAEYVTLGQGLTGFDALVESYRLIKSNYMGVLGRSFVLAMVIAGISMLFSIISMPLTVMGSFSDSMEVLAMFVRMISNSLAQFIGSILAFTFMYALYKDLVAKKPRPEVYSSSSKSFLYVFATVGIIFLFGSFAALGIGGKVFIEKDGFKNMQKYLETYSKNMTESNLDINVDDSSDLDVNIQQQLTQ